MCIIVVCIGNSCDSAVYFYSCPPVLCSGVILFTNALVQTSENPVRSECSLSLKTPWTSDLIKITDFVVAYKASIIQCFNICYIYRKQGNKLRRLMTFAWPCLLSKNCVDPATKYHGHLLLSHIIAKFAIHKRIVLQVWALIFNLHLALI